MNVDKKTCAPTSGMSTWESINWKKCENEVKRLQMRIVKAQKEGRHNKVKALQWTLTHSFYAKALAVKRVTENKGKRTSGVDGVLWSFPKSKFEAILKLKKRGYTPLPLKRKYIPKGNSGKMRPLGIPTMTDRAMQTLYKMALEPIAETTADPNSYGFRSMRSLHDAIGACFRDLSKPDSPAWILEGDIKGCFDNIGYDWLVKNIPIDKEVLRKWLKSGLVEENGELFPTHDGTPQGGAISPTLANMALDGLEAKLLKRFPHYHSKGKPNTKVNFVRYADDFIITGYSKEFLANDVLPFVESFMQERGLSLSKEKTLITHIDNGFDFLGQNVRKYNGVMLIKPSKKSIKAFLAKVRGIIKSNKTTTQEVLINKLNPVIRGWTNNHNHVVSGEIFSYVEHQIWKALWQWAKRRHKRRRNAWIKDKYFRYIKGRDWCFATEFNNKSGEKYTLELYHAVDTKIVRHPKIRANANPFDQDWTQYFEEREGVKMLLGEKGKQSLMSIWKRQKHLCPICNEVINSETPWTLHFEEVNSKTMKRMLHRKCHFIAHHPNKSTLSRFS